jgi:hypothetical protein
MKINTRTKSRDIELIGLFGEFELTNNDIIIKFFCTNANSRQTGSNEYEFLQELKPMRERVDASNLSNMEALMQRDLNDFRVANNLIPYILGDNSDVSFFPSILAVILPKNYLNGLTSEYPYPLDLESPTINYNDFWSVEYFKNADDQPMNVGKFTFNKSESNIIVIDGQHRANAFRYSSGVVEGANSIYDAFYASIDKNLSKEKIKNADLPVTLIWFENKVTSGLIDPRIISRKLFVDVNNNAKKINRSRSILLNEREVSCISTRVLYSAIAERGFDIAQFSLLHSGFDVDSDLKNNFGHPLTLTTPEIIEYILSWLLLGSKSYENLGTYKVARQRDFSNVAKFQLLTGFNNIVKNTTSEDDSNSYCIEKSSELNEFTTIFKNLFLNPLLQIYTDLNVYKVFALISKDYEDRIYSSTGVEQQAIWNKAYKGGEGLYYSINSNVPEPNSMLLTYKTALNQVDDKILELKLSKLNKSKNIEIKPFFEAITSKAFQVAVIIAFETFYSLQAKKRKFKTRDEAAEVYINLLNGISIDQWLFIFTEFKEHLPELKNLDPTSWPAYHKLILFLIQDNVFQSYSSINWEASPYGKVVKNRVEGYFSVFKLDNPDLILSELSDIPTVKIREWKKNVKSLMKKLITGVGKNDISGVNYDNKTDAFILELLAK